MTFELITPAFAGGAREEKRNTPGGKFTVRPTDGIRPPSLKGILRFWWRAMHPELRGEDLFKREAELFGAAGEAQGLCLVPKHQWCLRNHKKAGEVIKDALWIYFAYGPVAWEKEYQRQEIDSQTSRRRKGAVLRLTDELCPSTQATFLVRLPAAAQKKEELIKEFQKTLWLVSAFGTLGSRARRGWGSLRLELDPHWPSELPDPHGGTDCNDTCEKLKEGLQFILGERSNIKLPPITTEPLHTAFSPRTRIAIGPKADNATKALEKAYEEYYKFHRALGAPGPHHGNNVGADFERRNRWLTTLPQPTDETPYGSAFGLPHNAVFSGNPRPKVEVGVGEDLSGRRASPVFFKVLSCKGGFVPLVLWLPSLFLPCHLKPYVRSNRGSSEVKYAGDEAITWFFEGAPESIALSQDWQGIIHKGWKEVVW